MFPLMFISEALRFWIFTIFSVVLIGAGVWFLLTRNLGTRGTIAVWLIVGGAIGNLIDRVVLGSVSEFLYLGFVSIWGLFTVANLAIACGLGLLFFSTRVRGEKSNLS